MASKKKESAVMARVRQVPGLRVIDRVTPAQKTAMEEIAAYARAERCAGRSIPRSREVHNILVEETGLALPYQTFADWYWDASKI